MKKIIKPKKIIKSYFNYIKCTEYIERKYKIQTRNYAGKKFDGSKNDPAYQDFWHFILNINNEIHNGCVFNMNFLEQNVMCKESWQKEIFKLYHDEFADKNGDISFWVEW